MSAEKANKKEKKYFILPGLGYSPDKYRKIIGFSFPADYAD
jgi:hypothetical protein